MNSNTEVNTMSGYVTAAVAIAGSAASMYQQNKASKQAQAEADRQAQAAEKARLQQEQDFNRANQNTADIGALLQQNTPGGATGITGGTYMPGQLGSGGMLGR